MQKGMHFLEKNRHLLKKLITKFKLFTMFMIMSLILSVIVVGNWPNGTPNYTTAAGVSTWDGSSKDINFTGSGSAYDPYIIDSAAKLAGLASQVNDSSISSSNKYFKLTTDIDLGSHEWTPIGKSSNRFDGNFDGDGHTIKNLKITTAASHLGLFGMIDHATVKAVKVSGEIYITNYDSSDNFWVGGVSGGADYGNFEQCGSEVNITINGLKNTGSNKAAAGGLVGNIVGGSILESYSKGNISVSWGSESSAGLELYLGGLCGISYNTNATTIKDCYAQGGKIVCDEKFKVNGTVYAAGLLGKSASTNTTVTSCFADVDLTECNANDIGGLTGSSVQATKSAFVKGKGVDTDKSSSGITAVENTPEGKSSIIGILDSSAFVPSPDGLPGLSSNPENIQIPTVYINGSAGNDSNAGNTEAAAVKTMPKALAKVLPGGTIIVCGTITIENGTTETWDGASLKDGDTKVTISNKRGISMLVVNGTLTIKNFTINLSAIANSSAPIIDTSNNVTLEDVYVVCMRLQFPVFSSNSGEITLKNSNFKSDYKVISCENTTINLENVSCTSGRLIECKGTGMNTIKMKGKVYITSFLENNSKIVLTGDLADGSKIQISLTDYAEGTELISTEGSKTTITQTDKSYIKLLNSDKRLVRKGTANKLYYYSKPSWSVDISVDEVNKMVTLTPTLTNFVDGDRLSVSMLYPSGANGFIMSMLNNVDPVAFKLSLNGKQSWITSSNQGIVFYSNDKSARTLYYDFVNAEEPKYKGNYTGKIRFEAHFTEAT